MEVDNIVAALAQDRDSTLQELNKRAEEATAVREWHLKTRIATVALYLGDTSIASDMLNAKPQSAVAGATWDPTQHTTFVECFPMWCGSVQRLVPILRGLLNASLKSGISLAIGSVREPTSDAKRAWQDMWSKWHVDDCEGGTHSATAWALESWGLPLPTIPATEQAPERSNWHKTTSGLTMIRIPAGTVGGIDVPDSPQPITVLEEFWLSDKEITVGKFLEFLNDDRYDERPEKLRLAKPSHDQRLLLPATQVNWYDAVMFCNWLSHQEGRTARYKRGRKEQIRGSDGTVTEHDAWQVIPNASGYRLPTENEWEYACRARTMTEYSFGDRIDLMGRYATSDATAADRSPDIVGRRLCNAWGLFDMHGNANEWCQDWYVEGSSRVVRGGSFSVSVRYVRSDFCYHYQPNKRSVDSGFRVARTCP